MGGLPLYQLKGLLVWLLDLLITFNPPAVFLSGRWPANIDHTGPEGGDGFVFLPLFCFFASPITSPWKQVQALCCLYFGQIDVERGFFFALHPLPLSGIKGGGGRGAAWGLTGRLVVVWSSLGAGTQFQPGTLWQGALVPHEAIGCSRVCSRL